MRVTDDTHRTGTIGVTSAVSTDRTNGPIVLQTFYDDIYFTPVPEPSGLVLLMIALAGIAVGGRRRHG